jgi:hypothetical protein
VIFCFIRPRGASAGRANKKGEEETFHLRLKPILACKFTFSSWWFF